MKALFSGVFSAWSAPAAQPAPGPPTSGAPVAHSSPAPSLGPRAQENHVVKQESVQPVITSPPRDRRERTNTTLEREKREEDEFQKIPSGTLVEEVQHIVNKFSNSFVQLSSSLKKPNILLIGKTGAGKSTLVNAIFGREFAKTGNGDPVTKHLERYAPEDKPVVVYDTRGIENGPFEDFLKETQSYLNGQSDDIREQLHVVWYVIDMSHARFQPFESEICAQMFSNTPLFFVFNKADTADPQQLDAIRALVTSLKLSNCKGIFEVIADRKNYDVEFCPVCQQREFRFRQKTKEVICENEACKQVTLLGPTAGLEALVAATTSQLPHLARESFVMAQSVSDKQRIKAAESTVSHFTKIEFNNVLTCDILDVLLNMAAKLASLWDFASFSSVLTQEIVHETLIRKCRKSFVKKFAQVLGAFLCGCLGKVGASFVLATGIEVCRMLCEVKMKALQLAVNLDDDDQELAPELENCIALNVNDEWIKELNHKLNNVKSISPIVREEMKKRVISRFTKDNSLHLPKRQTSHLFYDASPSSSSSSSLTSSLSSSPRTSISSTSSLTSFLPPATSGRSSLSQSQSLPLDETNVSVQ